MVLFAIMLPLINFVLFVTFARLVSRSLLAAYVVVSMFSTLAYLISLYPQVVAGNVYIASVGN